MTSFSCRLVSDQSANRRHVLPALPVAFACLAGPAWAESRPVTVEDVRRAFVARPDGARRIVQQALKGNGYYAGQVDGLWGPGMQRAFERLMATERYRYHASRWTWSHEVRVTDTLFFLTSDAFPAP